MLKQGVSEGSSAFRKSQRSSLLSTMEKHRRTCGREGNLSFPMGFLALPFPSSFFSPPFCMLRTSSFPVLKVLLLLCPVSWLNPAFPVPEHCIPQYRSRGSRPAPRRSGQECRLLGGTLLGKGSGRFFDLFLLALRFVVCFLFSKASPREGGWDIRTFDPGCIINPKRWQSGHY